MTSAAIFKETYLSYLKQIKELDLPLLAEGLGIEVRENAALISLFGKRFQVSHHGIQDGGGRRPALAVCVILCRYLLMHPTLQILHHEMVAFKDLKDAGPLMVFFSHSVEGAIARQAAGRAADLDRACVSCGGEPFGRDLAYTVKYRFQGLPRVPVFLLFNDAEEGFGAKCTLLFERGVETYLDMECVAMLGGVLAEQLTACM